MGPQRGPGQGLEERRGQPGPRRPSRRPARGRAFRAAGPGRGPGAFLLWERPSRRQVQVTYLLREGPEAEAGR